MLEDQIKRLSDNLQNMKAQVTAPSLSRIRDRRQISLLMLNKFKRIKVA